MPERIIEETTDTDYQLIPDNTELSARLTVINEVTRKQSDGDGTFNRLKWKFKIEDPSTPYDGHFIYGDTADLFKRHPECRPYAWAVAIMGQELPVGYQLRTEDLHDLDCRIVISIRKFKTRSGEERTLNEVRDVLPSTANLAAAGSMAEEPF